MTEIPPDPARAAEKKALRAEARRRRAEAAARLPEAPERVARAALADLAGHLAGGAVVAGYVAVEPELDPGPLMAGLAARGHGLALPVVAARDAPLLFRAWAPGAPLEPGVLGIPVPTLASPAIVPHLLLVPLVAFDAAGRRLGQGGGYYDRTLGLRRREGPPVVAIGLGFAAQEFPALPEEAFDERLDGVATENGLRWFGRERGRCG